MATRKYPIQITREEHDEKLLAKKVSIVSSATLFVDTGPTGGGITTVYQGPGGQPTAPWDVAIVGNITLSGSLPPGTNYIGLATVELGSPLPAGTNNIGDVDIASLPSVEGKVDIIDRAARDLGKVDIAAFDVPLPPGTNNIGDVDVASLPTVNAVIQEPLSIDDNGGSITVDGTINANLNTGTNYIGLATVVIGGGTATITAFGQFYPALQSIESGAHGPIALDQFGRIQTVLAGNVTIEDGGGSITVDWTSGATVAVSNMPTTTVTATDLDIRDLTSATDSISAVQSGAWNVGLNTGTNWIGLATVTIGAGGIGDGAIQDGADPNIEASVYSTASGNALAVQIKSVDGTTANLDATGDFQVDIKSIAAGDNNIGNVDIVSLPTVNAVVQEPLSIDDGGGSITVDGTVTANAGTGPWPVTDNGGSLTVDWASGATVAVSNLPNVTIGTALPAGANYIGLVTVDIGTNNNIAIVGNVTINYLTSLYTAIQQVVSASGNTTIFVPPAGTRWILKDLIIGSLGAGEIKIIDGTVDIIPPISLATQGGYISNFGDSGLRSGAIDRAFVASLNGAATISILANVRFE